MYINYHEYTINSSCNMNERISTQPVPYEPPYRHNICLLQKMKYLQKFPKDFNIRWNFPNCIQSIDANTSESIARRTPAANILTTNSTIPLFCRLLWTQVLHL